jgi:hypothetical protein
MNQIHTDVSRTQPQAFMGKYDGSGQSTKAPVQMLEEKPAAPTNVWQQLGVQEPSAAANSAMQQSDDHGYKAPVQMLNEKPAPVNVWQQIGAQEPSAAANNVMKQSDDNGCVFMLLGCCISLCIYIYIMNSRCEFQEHGIIFHQAISLRANHTQQVTMVKLCPY